MNFTFLITAVLTPLGVGISGLVVWWIRRRLRLWEWAQVERRRRDGRLDELESAYEVLWERHADDKRHIQEMQKREEANDLMWRYFLMDLSMRPLLPNALTRQREAEEKREQMSDSDFGTEKQ